jgi:hypothetical protein
MKLLLRTGSCQGQRIGGRSKRLTKAGLLELPKKSWFRSEKVDMMEDMREVFNYIQQK